MFFIFFILFTGIPALELYLLFKVGAQIGALNTIFIIIGTGILGASLARSQGMALLGKIQNDINQGKIPASEIIQGFCVFGGGLLLLTPGFVTDMLGFCMIIPGTRSFMAFFIRKMIERGVKNGNVQFNFFQAGSTNPFQNKNNQSRDIFDAQYHETTKNDDIISVEYEKKDEENI